MRYRSPFIGLCDLLRHIADVATGGDREAAWDELLAAAADGAITAYGNAGSRIEAIPRWAWAAVRGDAGWIADGCLTASESNDPLHVDLGLYRRRWDDVRFRRDQAAALWTSDQPSKTAGPAIAADPPSPPALPEPASPIPNPTLVKHLRDIKAKGAPPPAADKLFLEVAAAFPEWRVTRQDVRTVHKEVFGPLDPGKRSKPVG